MHESIPAVVVGGGLGGLGVVRSLRRGHVPVVVVDASRSRPAMWSRWCRHVTVDRLYGRTLIDGLIALKRQIGEQAVLFLTDEMAVPTVSEWRRELEHAYRIRLPSESTVVDLSDKARFQRLAEEIGLPVPRSVIVEPTTDLRLLGELSFPVVIKPANKEAFYLGRTERIRKVNTLDEAIAVCTRALPNAGKVIVQEWIAGPDSNIYFCLFYRGKDGVIVSSFTGQKILSDPPEIGGTAICLAAPEVRNAIEPVTMAFADRVGFDGMGSLEFKWDPERARFVIIEPTVGRVDWQEEIATLCGVNIPLIAYRHETGLAPISVDRVPEDVAWRVSFIKRWPKQRSRSGTRVYDGYWRLDDPGPAVFYYVFYCTLEAIKKYALKPLLSAWNSGVIR